MHCSSRHARRGLAAALVIAAIITMAARASDHSDAPITPTGPRPDANITDLHAFVVGGNLVLSVSTNPTIPVGASRYVFPTDVTFQINIDVDCAVDPTDPLNEGGTIIAPDRIREDIIFSIRFDKHGAARVRRLSDAPAGDGSASGDAGMISFFAGLRDDPFIRGPRQGRNIGAIVLETPLSTILKGQSTLLIWATSRVDDVSGPFHELAGRSLKSMFPENAAMNTLHPRHHLRDTGSTPDVMIFDTARPAGFPNGRLLTDDVVDLVGDARVLANDSPFPSGNDLPFLTTFPYLAAPHP